MCLVERRSERIGPFGCVAEVGVAHLAPGVAEDGEGVVAAQARALDGGERGVGRGALAVRAARGVGRGQARGGGRGRVAGPLRVRARARGVRAAGGRHVAQRPEVDAAAHAHGRVHVCYVYAYIVGDSPRTFGDVWRVSRVESIAVLLYFSVDTVTVLRTGSLSVSRVFVGAGPARPGPR